MIITRHPSGSDEWVQWRNPWTIISAYSPADILPALREVEAGVATGRHALGFISYEAGPAFDPHFAIHVTKPAVPLLWFGLFDRYETFTIDQTAPHPVSWKPGISRTRYHDALRAIKRRIAAGDTYQVNYTFPLTARDDLSARDLFFQLVNGQPTPYAMLIETDDFAVASASPELFFSLDGDTVRVEPMKGTCPRGPLPSLDRLAGEQLQRSEKNRAENIMIVDMMRNDLGRVAVPGSVKAESLFDVTPWPTLWQMTSKISANTHATVPELFGALFPCASITGAPKLKTSEIIAELEVAPRGVYTGAIGWWFPGRRATFAVAIRTLVTNRCDGQTNYGIGSGVVWDSQPDDEYRECLLKARILTRPQESFQLLETMRWDPDRGFVLMAEHLKRMEDSAVYFGRKFHRTRAEARLLKAAASFPRQSQRVRLLARRDGTITIQHEAATQPGFYDGPDMAPEMTAYVDQRRTDKSSPLLYHKTTRRALYKQARRRCPDADDTLLVNRQGELMEFTSGNVVLALDGNLVTPEIAAGLLPGVFREKLITDGVLHPRTLALADLARASAIYFINSVRGWRRVRLLPS